MNIIGLDIGGANLKAANIHGKAASRAFPIWQRPEQLAEEINDLISNLGPVDGLAVTMTAELADCFATKVDGVSFILGKVEEVAVAAAGKGDVFVWQTGAEFVDPNLAREIPHLVAASNWHALATWLGRVVPSGPGLLVDIGTSTTDIIPLLDGHPVSTGLTDVERLLSGELLYTGVRRTPLFALAHSVPIRDGHCPMAAELFATTLDVNLLLDLIPEDATNTETANGKPATKSQAVDRLARMLCCDRTELSSEEVTDMAEFFHDVQKQRIRGCIDKVRGRLPDANKTLPHILISGSGTFLGEQIIAEHSVLKDADVTVLNSIYDAATSEAACAVAVARLAAERAIPNL